MVHLNSGIEFYRKGDGIIMPKKKKIDSKKLIKMVQEGKDQKEIMAKFNFKNSSQLKVAYANALMDSGKVPEIQSARGGKKAGAVKREVLVNKRGSLVIPKALVEDLGLKEGATFTVRPSKAGLSLKKM
jgi:bifunctional DNA-binding transcriptional regulator/antitoxin component of YhaV-PrlF toxin-antitoxin module